MSELRVVPGQHFIAYGYRFEVVRALPDNDGEPVVEVVMLDTRRRCEVPMKDVDAVELDENGHAGCQYMGSGMWSCGANSERPECCADAPCDPSHVGPGSGTP